MAGQPLSNIYLCNPNRGNSSVGRARPCQGRGREFESRFPLQSEGQFPADLFSCPDLPDGTLYDAAQGLREVEH